MRADSEKTRRMRLLMIINKPEREVDVLKHIARELSALSPGFTAMMVDYSDPKLVEKGLAFEPTIILTFPMTSKGLAVRHYVLKLALGCHLVTLQAEGIINYRDDTCYRYYAGLDEYGPDLIDMQMMWSRALVEKVGCFLLESGKIADPSRLVSVGFPKLEGYLGGMDVGGGDTPATDDFLARAAAYPREKVMFFATGFSLGEYTVEDLVRAKDIFDGEDAAKAEMGDAQRAIDASRAFRARLIRAVDEAAPRTPDALYVIKSHPVENILYKRKGINPYRELLRHPNVVYYDEPMYIKAVLQQSGVVFHFGSTILAESYLAKLPSVFVGAADLFAQDAMSANPNFNMHDMGWPSTHSCDVSGLADMILAHCREPLRFDIRRDMLDKLEEGFDVLPEHIEGTKPYRSIRRIAAAMMRVHHAPALPCRLEDPALAARIREHFLPAIMQYFGAAMAKRCGAQGEEAKHGYLARVKQVRELLAR